MQKQYHIIQYRYWSTNKMNKKIEELIKEFELFNDWEEKYLYIIELGKKLTALQKVEKIDKNKISECISQVWLIAKEKNGKIYFYADSNSLIIKGLLAIIIRIASNKSRKEIKEINFKIIFDKLDLYNHLTNSRGNGLLGVIKKVQQISQK